MKPLLVAAALVAFAVPANADTLYVAGPPQSSMGHPMRLGADHIAQQVGDLVQVIFNFNLNSTTSDLTNVNNNYSLNGTAGSGLLNLPLLRLGAGIGGSRASSLNTAQSASNAFTASMEATVTQVLPSGALVIAGDQTMTVEGKPQKLRITGVIRREDISNADTVLSSNVANANANFDGPGFNAAHKGLLQKITDFLF
jgi:flagellar L-ring protein precursor FlgH